MKDDIIDSLNDPKQLEKMYRNNKVTFKREFSILYPDLKGNPIADCWNERLYFESDEMNWGTGRELIFVVIASLLAGLFAKLPAFLAIDEDFFYPRNVGFIIFPALMAYFIWKNKLETGKIIFILATIVVGLVFINFLPDEQTSDTLILSCLHLTLFLWSILGFTFVGNTGKNEGKRLGFLKY